MRVRVVGAVVALVLSLGACSAPSTVLITHDHYESGISVRQGGVLVLRDDGCLGARVLDGTVVSLILPRKDSSYRDGTLWFHGKAYPLGSDFYFGLAGQQDISKIGLEVPNGCAISERPIIVGADNT
jgi:hypothetical protein